MALGLFSKVNFDRVTPQTLVYALHVDHKLSVRNARQYTNTNKITTKAIAYQY